MIHLLQLKSEFTLLINGSLYSHIQETEKANYAVVQSPVN